jgi:predicted amidohydrolase YtcJ
MIGEPPAWAGTERVLLRGGFVYSPADPFATAMLVHGPQIAWVGSEGAALAMADGVDEVIDLDGALVTPAFVDADARPTAQHGLAGLRAAAAPAGIAALQVLADPPGDGAVGGPGPLVTFWGSERSAVEVADAAALAEVLAAAQRTAADSGSPSSGGLRLHGAPGAGPADIAVIAELGATVVLTPDLSEGFAGVPVAALAAAGVPLALGSGAAAPDPWATVRAAVHHPDPDQRISSRAAFAAHTRGGWRAAGHPELGTLVPGGAAHYAVWEVGDLIVEAPDDRIQAWSTDPRSGTPGLPDLRPGAPAPRCRRTVVWGRPVWD